MLTPILACLFALALFLAMTWPEELRRGRWLRIAASLPLVYCIVEVAQQKISRSGIALILSIVILAYIWAGHLSYYLGNRVVKLLFGDANPDAGFRPDFRYARVHIRDGDYPKAVQVLQVELGKDAGNYEGLMLLASAYALSNEPARALIQLDLILANPAATDAQKEQAQAEKRNCEQLRRHLAAKTASGRSD